MTDEMIAVFNDHGGPAVLDAMAEWYRVMSERWSHDAEMRKECCDRIAILTRAASEMRAFCR